ncbi:MAG: TrkH family potassium uptake protein [Melioribacteraceae bacterium]|nr:TrkH family potassium uptake protein [Melioribacteraceae bacterium]
MLNIKIILNFIGFVLILNGLFMMLGIPFSIYYGANDILILIACGLGTSFIGLMLVLATRDHKKEIYKRDGYIMVSLTWIMMALFGAIPFVVHGAIPSYTDSFFETMSGFTTTGASILNNIEELPHGLLFWRSMTQWLGGMGVIVLSIAILPMLGIGGMQLFVAEVPGPTKDKIHPRVRETAKRLWGIYVLFTLVQTGLLLLGGMNLFDAVNHSFTTMATGGFSTKQASIAAYDSPFIHYVMIIFMFIAGTNFTLHYHLLHKNFKVFTQNDEFKFYLKLIGTVTLVVIAGLFISQYSGVEKTFRDALFQTVSIITTTGYVTADYELWGPFFQVLFFLLLFTGGSAGSTGGGIKMVRHFVLIKNSFSELKRLIHPRAVIPVRFNKGTIASDIISNVLAFFLFYIFIFILGTLVMSLIGMDFLSAIGASATSLGNVGPGIGTVGPTLNFANVPEIGKWVLSFLMLMGRLELFTVLIIFSPAFWQK